LFKFKTDCFILVQVIAVENETMLNRTLNLLAGIRQGNDQFDLAAEIDKAMGALVKNLGPEVLLSKIPLQASKKYILSTYSYLKSKL